MAITEDNMTQSLIASEKQQTTRTSLIARHPLVSYFALAYAIAWLIWLPLVLSKGGGIGLLPFTTDSTVDGAITLSFIIVGALGPACAAIIMTAITEGKAGVRLLFRRMLRVRVGWQWYLVALFLPLLPVLFFLLLGALSTPDQYSHVFSSQGGIALIAYIVAALTGIVLGSPIGEEPGWRGFALPRLQQQMGPFKGTILLGTLWGLWHAPLAFFTVWGSVYQHMGSIPGFLLFILCTICFSVLMTCMFNQTRGSIFLAILFHAAIDSVPVINLILFPDSINTIQTTSGPILLAAFALNVAVWGVIAGTVLIATRGRLSYQPSIEQEVHPQHMPAAEQPEPQGNSAS
jgi:membrane protease YdiL (CAAX protease family)